MKVRSYFGEPSWALEQINIVNHDRNPNRQAQLKRITDYGLKVAIAKRSHEPLPERPDIKNCV